LLTITNRTASQMAGNAGKPAGSESMIRFDSVGVRFGALKVLDDVCFDMHESEFVCLIGPSGSGKTTLLRLLSGLQAPSEGRITYKGVPHTAPNNDIAVVFQDYVNALLPWRTAAGNVSLALEAAGVPSLKRAPRIAALLKSVGLERHADSYPRQMSGGMQQRLQIARCLAQNPSVLLMDEPFGALDAMTRQRLQDEVLTIARSSKVTVFFVTHDLEEAIYLGDRVIALQANPGRVARVFDVPLPHPRDQLTTRESPEFLKLRRELFKYVQETSK
jgi:NitT/TauT family transport system ATP-binding protein